MKSKLVIFRMPPPLEAALKKMAEQRGMNISETIRDAIQADARRAGLWPPAATGQGGANGRK